MAYDIALLFDSADDTDLVFFYLYYSNLYHGIYVDRNLKPEKKRIKEEK